MYGTTVIVKHFALKVNSPSVSISSDQYVKTPLTCADNALSV